MMKAKISVFIFLASLLVSIHAETVKVTVVDDGGIAVEGATVDVWYAGFKGDGSDDVQSSGLADKQGRFVSNGNAKHSIGVIVSMEGWYASRIERLRQGQNHDIAVVLRKNEKPIPLFVREMKLEFPSYDEWLGFDFEVGDWTSPYGKGKSKDILFKLHRQFKGYRFSEEKMKKMRFPDSTEEDLKRAYGRWDSKFFIGFSSKLEGITEEKIRYLNYSKLKMPHLAPEEGYKSEEIVIEKKSSKRKSNKEEMEEIQKYIKFGDAKPSGHFIRTRVTEEAGEIIKANYVKLNEAIEIDVPRNRVVFTYYFNPAVNDRNLEFRTQSNLATEQRRGYAP